jgi:dephospho-CoA kinase
MTEHYGGPEEWQKFKTTEWISQIRDQFLSSTNILFDGQTRPTFIEESCISENITSYKIILLDCSDEERKRRLFIRGQKELADENMMNWARYLRTECEQRHYQIIDNTKLNEKETVSQLLECLTTQV